VVSRSLGRRYALGAGRLINGIHVTHDVQIRDDRDKALLVLEAHRDRCLANYAGTLQCELLAAKGGDTKVTLYEVYKSKEAFEAHWGGESVKQAFVDFRAAGIKISHEDIHAVLFDYM